MLKLDVTGPALRCASREVVTDEVALVRICSVFGGGFGRCIENQLCVFEKLRGICALGPQLH